MPEDFDKNDASDQDAKRARRTAKAVRDILRKTLLQGGEARQSTEDLLRALLGEVKIPREYANVILQQINATRGELLSVVADEVRTFLHDANLGEELAKILTSLSFEIRTEIRFIPNEDVLRPSVKSRVGVKSARPRPKPRVEPQVDEDDEDEFVETRGSAALDKAIQSRVASLANMFLKGFIEVEDDEEDADNTFSTPSSDESFDIKTTPPPRRTPSEDVSDARDLESDEPTGEDDDEHSRGGFSARDLRLRMSLGPDFRRRAEAAASQVASAGRVTASRSAATAASAVSAAANRAQAVVRGGRNLATPDLRDEMWKRWVGPGEEPDLVGNPVIGARGEHFQSEAPRSSRDPVHPSPATRTSEASIEDAKPVVEEELAKATPSKPAKEPTGAKGVNKDKPAADTAETLVKTSEDTASSSADTVEAARETSAADRVEALDDGTKGARVKTPAATSTKREARVDASQASESPSGATEKKSTAARKSPASSKAKSKPASGASAAAEKKSATGTSAAAKKKSATGTSAAAKKKAAPKSSTPKKSTKGETSTSGAASNASTAPATKAKESALKTTASKPTSKSRDAAPPKSSTPTDESTSGED